jgi:two-component system LytT family response regulator
MIKAIIVDDETKGREVLENILCTYHNHVIVVASCDSALSAISAIKKFNPEVVFLDIEMPGGNGFKVLEECKNIPFDVIFTTAHNQYAIKAFRYSAIDYLLKPINKKELEEALDKTTAKQKNGNLAEKVNFLMETIQHKNEPFDRIAVHTLEGFHILTLKEIIRFEANSNYTILHLINKKKITIAKTLKEYEEMLSENSFIRVHQSHLININHVKRYIKGEGGTAIMIDESQVEISRRNKSQFLAKFTVK